MPAMSATFSRRPKPTTRCPRPPRIARSLVPALVALALAGCGDRDLILNVDLTTFLPPSQSDVAFGPVPTAPSGLWTGEQALVDDQEINLIDGLSNAVIVKDVGLTLTTIAAASTGSGTDTLRVYLSDKGTDPRTTSPVLVQVLGFSAGVADTAVSTTGNDSRIADLFTQKAMQLTITTSLRGPAGGSPLNGSLDIAGLKALVVASRKRL